MKAPVWLCLAATLLLISLILVPAASASTPWVEYSSNPVYAPGSKTYYPCVLYDASQFSGHGDAYYYKMWYSTGDTIRLAYSNDGKTWTAQGTDLNDIPLSNHPIVLYNSAGFGGGSYCYKLWYWHTSSEYTNPIWTADSLDGINWVNAQPIGEDPSSKLVEGWVTPYWFYSSYGPAAVLYSPSGYASINTGDPMGNKYVMYYDASSQGYAPDGSTEGTALAVSADGLYWSRIGSEPVVKAGGGSTWDSGYVYAWSVQKVSGTYYMYYSGGQTASNAGVGTAQSTDGVTWTKQSSPVFHVSDGVTWRQSRTYTPCAVYDNSEFSGHGDSCYWKMWYTGVSGSTYSIGYAYIPNLLVTPEYPVAVLGVAACLGGVLVFKLSKSSVKSMRNRFS